MRKLFDRNELRRQVDARRGRGKTRPGDEAERLSDIAHEQVDGGTSVVGPSPNPATNILLAEIVLRVLGRIARESTQKAMLGRRYGAQFAKDTVKNKSLIHTLTAYGATKMAARSVPGAIVLGTVAGGKLLFDLSRNRRQARRDGEKFLADQADADGMA